MTMTMLTVMTITMMIAMMKLTMRCSEQSVEVYAQKGQFCKNLRFKVNINDDKNDNDQIN